MRNNLILNRIEIDFSLLFILKNYAIKKLIHNNFYDPMLIRFRICINLAFAKEMAWMKVTYIKSDDWSHGTGHNICAQYHLKVCYTETLIWFYNDNWNLLTLSNRSLDSQREEIVLCWACTASIRSGPLVTMQKGKQLKWPIWWFFFQGYHCPVNQSGSISFVSHWL